MWNGSQLPYSITTDPTLGAAIDINGPATANRELAFSTNNVGRWSLTTIGGAEGGGNAGSDFGVFSYTDAGAPWRRPIFLSRDTGVMTLSSAPIITSIANAANDAAAAAAGVQLGGVYRTGSALMVRIA
jgi:hypothetical protein